jgi:DNA-binding beta-propeller fold protein YncE
MKFSRSASLIVLFLALFTSQTMAYQEIELTREIGDPGKKAKERRMNAPRAAAVSDNQMVFIADTDAHRVVVLDAQGQIQHTWGSKGDQPRQFRSPVGIALDECGRVYVADTGNHRIQVFNSKGGLLRVFGSKGSGPREFKNPSGIVAQQGFLYVADKGNDRIQILSYDGIYISQIVYKPEKDEMKSPVTLAIDRQNRLYVPDASQAKYRVFDPSGKLIAQYGSKGRGLEGLDEPQGIAVDACGFVYISDAGNYKLKKFDQQGKLVASIGSKGTGPGQFREMSGLAIDRGNSVYQLDADKSTLQIFLSDSGACQPLVPAAPPISFELSSVIPGAVTALAPDKRLWALGQDSVFTLATPSGPRFGTRGSESAQLRDPAALAADGAGNVWVADTGNDRLQKFSPDGVVLQVVGTAGSGEGQFSEPSGIAISAKGKLFIADTGNKRIQVLSPKGVFLGMFGKKGKGSGQFSEPVALAVNDAEQVFVVDRGNNRISKFDGNGSLLWEKGKTGSQEGEFKEPSNILVTPEGELYVLDAGNARIQILDDNGNFLGRFGCEGETEGQFKSPRGMALENRVRLCVGDGGNNRVQVFTLHQTPAAPRDLVAQGRPNEVQLTWKRGRESYIRQYAVYRADAAAGPFVLLGTAEEPLFTDKGLQSNRAFYYQVTSRAREGNESAVSAVVSAVTPKLMPAAPRKVRIDASEKQMTLSWLPNLEPFVSHYQVYRSKQPSSGFELTAKLDKAVFVDRQLSDETYYYYQVTAVGREGDESPVSDVVYASTPKASLTQPPLEIASVEIGNVFASSYKYYETHPVGKIVIRNTSGMELSKIKAAFSIRDYMDYPTEIEIESLPAQQQKELQLKPIFNNRILEVTENTSLQSQIALSFYFSGEQKTVTRSFPVTLYERHAMVWDQKAKLGGFVTPKDPPLADFTRAVIRHHVDAYPNLPQPLVFARALYDALGVLGVKYIVDPTSPYQGASQSASVDYLQYPRDTLARRSGDCDDLSILFAAGLENLGIETAFVDVPGHVFIMFNSGVPDRERATLGMPDQLLVSYQGAVWIPVEMTIVGESFTRAWQKGAEEIAEWSDKGKADFVSTEKSWDQFKPATLPHTDFRPAAATREEIESKFKGELDALAKTRLDNLSRAYLAALKKNPRNADALGKLGILYAENGLLTEALEQFRKITAIDPKNAIALNNIGNIHYLQNRTAEAKAAYEASLASEPGDVGVMVNLSRICLTQGDKAGARKLFANALALDPRVARRFGDLAATLGMEK